MFTQSLWNSFSGTTDFPALQSDLQVDVAIIGGGITGITTAQLLSKEGFNVAVLEARKVGGGTTSHSTGNLYFTIDKILSSLQSKYDNEIIRNIVSSRYDAMNLIEKNVKDFNIDCDFERVPWYLYSDNEENASKIEQELETAREAGVNMEEAKQEEIPFHINKGVKVGGQAQFNAMRYVQELSKKVEGERCRIFENSRVTSVEDNSDGVVVHTLNGKVSAKYAVHATHTPKGVEVQYHTTLGPYREYAVAVKLKGGTYPKGIFWGYYGKGEKVSMRSYERGEEKFVLAVGEPHKVGQAKDNEQHIKNLVSFLEQYFEIEEVTHRWGGQHYKPADLLPYIGKKTEGSREFVATGFSTDGLTYGTLAAMLISDEIGGKENLYSEMYAAKRFTPMKSAKEFIKENVNVAVQYVKDLPFSADEAALKNLKTGEGTILEKDGHKVAAMKNELGEVKMHSAFCTHLSCVVHWNNAEKTWDCPCHGSRFDSDGMVLEGPALHPLKRIEKEGDETKSVKRE